MVGWIDGSVEVEVIYCGNFIYVCDRVVECGMVILVELINYCDVLGYYLSCVEQVVDFILVFVWDNLKLMFDCYYVQIMQGDLIMCLQNYKDLIGYIQIVVVLDCGELDQGEVYYLSLIVVICEMGFSGLIGVEYKFCGGIIEVGFGWFVVFDDGLDR